ncbi:MAG TPA: chemotaxis protein CheB [Azospirillum sp.]
MTTSSSPPCVDAVVIGCSAGGLEALREILHGLPADFPVPIVVVAHHGADGDQLMAEVLERDSLLKVSTVEEKQPATPGHVHLAPGAYHLLVESDGTFSLTVDPKVCNCRPAIDVLFETAADAYGERLIGVLLTGANHDGSHGLLAIRRVGGRTVVQDPATAAAATMPQAAIDAGAAGHVLPLRGIATFLRAAVAGE